MMSKPAPNATLGEKQFYNRMEYLCSLRPELICYTEPGIGGNRPDFLILSPFFGILIVEVKDYLPESLRNLQKSGYWVYLKDDNLIHVDNPFDQIYQYWRAIKDRVNFCKFPEETKVQIIQLVCFSNISKDGMVADEIRKLCPERIHICFKETLSRNNSFEAFFNDLIPINFMLTDHHFDILRANIVPSCRLPSLEQSNLDKYFTAEEKVKLLDQNQERLARKLGTGHRLLFGVAGSGKTVLLIARARYLAKMHPNWKILILCYNRLLRDLLYHLIIPQDYEADITVNTFHGWARSYIQSANNNFTQLYTEAQQKAERERSLNDFFEAVVPNLLLQMLRDLGEKKVYYDAILIDEAQDFQKDWFRAVIEVLNPEHNTLLITCDGLQGIYARKQFHWSEVGIQARGRVQRFEKSYRTPIQIGILAQRALPETLRNLLDSSDEFLSTKEFKGEEGSFEIVLSETRSQECRKLAEKIARLLKQPQQILVLFRYNMVKRGYDHQLFRDLSELGIQWRDLENHNYNAPGLLIGTIHGTKGLECDTIIIPEVDRYISDEDRQLLYVGITRSRKKLILSASKATELMGSFQEPISLEKNPADGK